MSTPTIWKRLFASVFALAVLTTACGDDDGDDVASTDEAVDSADDDAASAEDTAEESDEPAEAADDTAEDSDEPEESDEPAEAADLELSTTDLGDVLVDANGNTLYLFTPDGQGDSTCYDECEANWPIVGELSTVGDGLDASLLGTTERTTGDVQATYNGWPLYYFVNDTAPGETNGQGVNDVWYVLDADGNAIDG